MELVEERIEVAEGKGNGEVAILANFKGRV